MPNTFSPVRASCASHRAPPHPAGTHEEAGILLSSLCSFSWSHRGDSSHRDQAVASEREAGPCGSFSKGLSIWTADMHSLCAALNFRNFLILMCCPWHKRHFLWETCVVFEVAALTLLESCSGKASRKLSLCPGGLLWPSQPTKHFVTWLDHIEFHWDRRPSAKISLWIVC